MILIISVASDSMTDAVCKWLSYQNKRFIRLHEKQFIDAVFFDFQKDIFEIHVEGVPYSLKEFQSVYYRNGSLVFKVFDGDVDDHLAEFFRRELSAISQFISYLLSVSNCKLFGNLLTQEVNKLQVLHIAKTLGFIIPDTYIISCLKDISKIDVSLQYITKAVSEMQPIFSEDGLHLNYTREIGFDDLADKSENIVPSLLQKKIEKLYEIRVFFFENKIWAIATFEFSDSIDGRNIKSTEKKYIPYELPTPLKEKIFSLKNFLGLGCGTIDLLKTENDFYFLEVNPLGQFHVVSHYGNYNIEKHIAELL